VAPDGVVWSDALLSEADSNVLNIMFCGIVEVPRVCAEGVAGIAGERTGLFGAREIAAIVSANVLLVSERSLFESVRTRRLASNACNSSLVLESCQPQSGNINGETRTLLAVLPR
jgi:hypothetical protein